MNNPIIINNIDVKDCCYLRVTVKENFCTCNSTWREDTVTSNFQCELNPNCYYKELKKLKINIIWNSILNRIKDWFRGKTI